MARPEDVLGIATTVARVAYEQEIKYPAAAIAYYAFVSFVPLLLLVFAIIGERFATQIHTTTPRFLTPAAQQLVYESTTTASGRTGAALLAIVVLAWSGVNVATGFQAVIERIEVGTERPLSDQLFEAVAVLGSLALAIVSIVLTSTFFALRPAVPPVAFVTLFAALTGVFVPLYYVPSQVLRSPSAALPGAVTAAFGWATIHTAIQFYAANAGRYAIYGVLSGIIIILTSLYAAAAVLMIGAIVNTTLADGVDPSRSSRSPPHWRR